MIMRVSNELLAKNDSSEYQNDVTKFMNNAIKSIPLFYRRNDCEYVYPRDGCSDYVCSRILSRMSEEHASKVNELLSDPDGDEYTLKMLYIASYVSSIDASEDEIYRNTVTLKSVCMRHRPWDVTFNLLEVFDTAGMLLSELINFLRICKKFNSTLSSENVPEHVEYVYMYAYLYYIDEVFGYTYDDVIDTPEKCLFTFFKWWLKEGEIHDFLVKSLQDILTICRDIKSCE